jgi:ribonucleotide reductase beta subunit family protein with ferritin-like domain
MLHTVLLFFAGSDSLVLKNVETNFASEVYAPEVTYYYAMQAMQEAIHAESYALLLQEYFREPEERRRVEASLADMATIAAKNSWVRRWLQGTQTFRARLVAFALVEGVFFSASFAIIFWFRRGNLLPGLSLVNSLIARDEGLHVRFAGLLYSKLRRRLTDAEAHVLAQEAAEIELKFADEVLREGDVAHLSIEHLKQHVLSVVDIVLDVLGHPPLYGVKTPLEYMERLAVSDKENFFEHRVTNYQRYGSGPEGRPTFNLTEDF